MKAKADETTRVYLIGSGIANLAAAFYLIEDAGVDPQRITIYEQWDIAGGALDGSGDPEHGYLIRGGRMHEKHYHCYWDLLSHIPSYDDPDVTVYEETIEFNERYVSDNHARLLKEGKRVDLRSYRLSLQDQFDMTKLLFTPESELQRLRIEDWFSGEFFQTNYWLIFTSMFAFQKWSSLMEARRYMLRFMHLMPGMKRLQGILRTKYNQYHSVVVPLQQWLGDKGVRFELKTRVVDIDFDLGDGKKRATHLHLVTNGESRTLEVGEKDYCFLINGSIVDAPDEGDLKTPARLKGVEDSGSWSLWKKIAAKDPDFGNPDVFCGDIDRSKWYSYTVTLRDRTFHDYMEDFTGNLNGTGGLITLTDSNWLMSIVIARQPHFPDQPNDVKVFWGYGLYVDRVGNKVKKPMSECTGEEILRELWYHLKIEEMMEPIMQSERLVNCIPVAMPFIDSLFMPRAFGDRPAVLPEGTENFAFLGQFTEVKDDCVFTVEYSVRTAQMAVFGLFDCGKEPLPVYVGAHNPIAMMKAAAAIAE
ncbi:oleate hydratase [Hydrogenimonas cancrithermarum]|uniref:Oleate hydratase n=1 Tax=Hydrogenimonas cancrithermarum TaxID=2993563 RepID=A0ABM8FHL3_9BACT|nr:oleate hydratase [Hydrogenimonas cancrithermarum]BDY11756.1 oleate hydratase [Hydrogenimonas cancrithermarum]